MFVLQDSLVYISAEEAKEMKRQFEKERKSKPLYKINGSWKLDDELSEWND